MLKLLSQAAVSFATTCMLKFSAAAASFEGGFAIHYLRRRHEPSDDSEVFSFAANGFAPSA